MKKIIIAILSILAVLMFAGCNDTESGSKASLSSLQTKITAQEAKTIIEQQTNVIILDVRTESEFAEGHIAGAILIPDDEIAAKAEKALPDKDHVILVYCRTGRRSALAAQELVKLGYTHVLDFGGIVDWPYGTVK